MNKYIEITIFYKHNNRIRSKCIVPFNYTINDDNYAYKYLFNCKDNDKPSFTYYDDEGNISLQYWMDKEFNLHRENGPAIIEYINGIPRYKEYWVCGKKINRIEVNG